MKIQPIPSLDGIRALCIAMVLGAHASKTLDFPSNWSGLARHIFAGEMGVLIFFVLSGFLITFLLCAEMSCLGRISLSNFYARRVLRIVPVYLAYFLMMTTLHFAGIIALTPCQFLTTATYTKNFGCGAWIDGHLWSVSVEEQFYLIWPLMLAFLPRRAYLVVAASLILLAPLFRVAFYFWGYQGLLRFSFMTNMDALMIGSLTGILYHERRSGIKSRLTVSPLLCQLACLAAIFTIHELRLRFIAGTVTVPFGTTIQSFAASYLIVSLASAPAGWLYTFCNLAPVRYLGRLSYSIYIWQQAFLWPAFNTSEIEASLLTRFPVNLLGAVAVAMASYHLFEMPLVRLRRHFRPLEREASAHAEKMNDAAQFEAKPDFVCPPGANLSAILLLQDDKVS